MDCKRIKKYGWAYCLFWVLCMGWQPSWAQTDSSLTKHGLTYKLLLIDYNSLDPIYQRSNPERFFHPEDINYAAALGYHYRLKPSLQLGAVLRVGSMDAHHEIFDEQDSLCQPCDERRRDELFVGLDALGQYHFANGYLLPEQHWIAPYVMLGVGAVYMNQRRGYWDVQVPMGLGVNIHFSPQLAFQIQTEYRLSLAIQKHSLALSAGIFWQLGRSKPTE